jgi:hypothetical protein
VAYLIRQLAVARLMPGDGGFTADCPDILARIEGYRGAKHVYRLLPVKKRDKTEEPSNG